MAMEWIAGATPKGEVYLKRYGTQALRLRCVTLAGSPRARQALRAVARSKRVGGPGTGCTGAPVAYKMNNSPLARKRHPGRVGCAGRAVPPPRGYWTARTDPGRAPSRRFL